MLAAAPLARNATVAATSSGVLIRRDGRRLSIGAMWSVAALLAGIQGGVGIMLATGDLTHLEAALDAGIDALRLAG